MNQKKAKQSPLEQGLLTAMRAIDKQISKAVQTRTPEELEKHKLQKWEPISERIELVAVLVMNALGDNQIQVDSILVLAQAMSKALQLAAEDLGSEGLGKLRTAYCLEAFEQLSKYAQYGKTVLGEQPLIM